MSDRDYIDFEMIKEKVSMPDLLDHYGLADKMEKKDSDTLIGPCPITGSDGQVFKVDTQKDIWYSFALEEDGAGGNVLDFVARMEDAEVLEAAHLINDWLSLESQEADEPDTSEEVSYSEDGETSAYAALSRLCKEEIEMLEGGARAAIEDELESGETGGKIDDAAVADRLSEWILRAYQRGYELGKMQGRIDERINELLA